MTDWLDQLIGEWTYDSRSVPDDPQYRRSGTETVTRHGAWIVIAVGDESRFQITLDPATGKATGDFIHWAHPVLWTYEGGVEDGALHLRSSGPSFDIEGATADYDDVFEITGADTRRTVGRMKSADGEWRDFIVTHYRRKR